MATTTITVGSVTYALKVKKILQHIKIKSKLIKVDSSKTKSGCEYGIEIPSLLFFDVVSELKARGINYAVYSGEKI